MGICHTKKSIQEIIHSKYTLAKDQKSQNRTSQFYHVYVWKYTSDDLALKDVRFYDCEIQYKKEAKEKKLIEENESQNEEPDFLQGQPLQWPIKTHADEGYIILTIKNNKKLLRTIVQSFSSQNEQDQQSNDFRNKKVSLEMLQILYMIHLDSFKSYYFAEIKQEKSNNQFEASIEIITGDLLERVDCLKLITISYELEKYLKAGGHNVLKKFYNQFDAIAYFDSHNLALTQNQISKNLVRNNNNIITEELQKKTENKELHFSNQFEIERILLKEIKRIQNSENFETQQLKNYSIEKLFSDLYFNFYQFNVLKISILYGVEQKAKELQPSISKTKNPNNFIPKQITESFSQQFFSNSKQQQNQKINVFKTVNRKNLENLVQSKGNQTNQQHKIEDFQNIDNDDISIIEKPSNKNKNNKKQALDTSSPFICEITEIGGLQQSFDEGLMLNGKDNEGDKMIKKTNKFSKKEQILMQNGDIEDSLFLPKQLQQLQIDRNIYKISPKLADTPQCHLLLTTYAGSSQFQQLQKQNVSLIINLSPSECYNYFIHDISYKWYSLEPLHKKLTEEQLFVEDINYISEENQYLYNLESLVYWIVDQIDTEIQSVKETGDLKKARVMIFCNHKNLIYSGTAVVAYLMFVNAFRLNFDQAYQTVKQSTKNKFQIPKVFYL